MDKFSELKVTIPADKKSHESVAAGFVTDNNSGGYFVIECQECGAVFPSQQADGGGQIADTGDYNDAICPHCGEEGPEECDNVGLAWNVQQAKIIALLAELEQANKRAEVESVGADKSAADCVQWMKRAEAAEKRIAELEAKLAIPVRLPRTLWYEHDDLPREIPVLEKGKVKAAIRAAGFKCEGDE
ncbi:MAG: hypothetical protein WCD24_03840 [Serratia inhibens]|uniref:C2H2-type zinc finger protein n=1 Tax=Serratia inhibens TaxID=2338073 RepID=UPI003C7E216A